MASYLQDEIGGSLELSFLNRVNLTSCPQLQKFTILGVKVLKVHLSSSGSGTLYLTRRTITRVQRFLLQSALRRFSFQRSCFVSWIFTCANIIRN